LGAATAIEQAGWGKAMYRDDLEGSSALVASALADWSAQEAAIQMNHMRLADSLLDQRPYVAEKTQHRPLRRAAA